MYEYLAVDKDSVLYHKLPMKVQNPFHLFFHMLNPSNNKALPMCQLRSLLLQMIVLHPIVRSYGFLCDVIFLRPCVYGSEPMHFWGQF